MKTALDLFVPMLVAFLVGLLVATMIFYHTPSINCPQEDSCHADYSGNAWHITFDPNH